jgi:hypothetical protein
MQVQREHPALPGAMALPLASCTMRWRRLRSANPSPRVVGAAFYFVASSVMSLKTFANAA